MLPNDGITNLHRRDHSRVPCGSRNLPRIEKSRPVCDELPIVSGSADRRRPSGLHVQIAGMRPKGVSPSGQCVLLLADARHDWSLTGHRLSHMIGSRTFQGWRRGAGRFSGGVSHGQTRTNGCRKTSIAWGILLQAEGVDSDAGQSRKKAGRNRRRRSLRCRPSRVQTAARSSLDAGPHSRKVHMPMAIATTMTTEQKLSVVRR